MCVKKTSSFYLTYEVLICDSFIDLSSLYIFTVMLHFKIFAELFVKCTQQFC